MSSSLFSPSSIETHQDWLRPRITCKLRQDWLHPRKTYKTYYIRVTYELFQDFMLRQPVSLVMLELPLSRDLDLDHILELHCSSLHYTKMQVKSIKSNSSFQKKDNTSQIVEQVATYFAWLYSAPCKIASFQTSRPYWISNWRSNPRFSSSHWHYQSEST